MHEETPEIAAIKAILSKWNVTGYVVLKEEARRWAVSNLSSFSLKSLAKQMNDHILAGKKISQVRETRPEWDDRPFHFDFRLPWEGRKLYIETVLVDDDPTDPLLQIVRIKDV